MYAFEYYALVSFWHAFSILNCRTGTILVTMLKVTILFVFCSALFMITKDISVLV